MYIMCKGNVFLLSIKIFSLFFSNNRENAAHKYKYRI